MIFAFYPYKFAHLLGHYNLVTTQWIPFYILFLARMTKESSKRKFLNGVWAGLFLFFTALTDHYYLIFLGIFTILYLGHVFFNDRKRIINLSFFKSFAILIGTFFIGFLPVLSLAIMEILHGQYAAVPMGGHGRANTYVADLFAFFTPSVLHPALGKCALTIAKHFKDNAAEWTVFTGYTVIFWHSLQSLNFIKKTETLGSGLILL